MSDNLIKKTVIKDKLVFAIRFHEFLDVLILPYQVHESSNGEFSYSSKQLNSLTLPDHFKQCSEEEKQVVSLLDECRDEELMKRFSKKTKNVPDFYKELTESRLKTLVIPYVQKRIDNCLRILMNKNIPLFYKGRKNDPVISSPIIIKSGEAKAVFSFTRYNTESHYSLTLRYNETDILLNTTGSIVLVNTPGWVLTGGKVYLLESGIDGGKLKPFFTKEYIVIPSSSEEKYFSGFVLNTIKNYEVRTKGFELLIEEPLCKPILKLETDLAGNPVLLLYFKYESKSCLWSDQNNCWVEFITKNNNYSYKKILRKRESERKFIDILVGLGLVSKELSAFYLPEPGLGKMVDISGDNSQLYSLVEWMSKYSDKLEDKGFLLQQGFNKDSFYTGSISMEINISEHNDWFDVFAYAVFGEFKIPFARLKSHLLQGIREYPLPDGQLVILPEEWFGKYKDLLIFGKTGKDNIRLRKHHFTIAEKIINGAETHVELFRLDKKDKLPVPEIPKELSGVLRPYQRAGFSWMYFLHSKQLGGCLADDMGLGKTLQTLTLLLKLKNKTKPDTRIEKTINRKNYQMDLFSGQDNYTSRPIKTSLIVMPLSLMHNWENEIIKFTPGLSCIKYSGISRDLLADKLDQYDIILTTYGVVRNDLEFLRRFEFFYLILDESQMIKNPKSKISRAVRLLKAENRLVLTGTPVENSLTDLWSQLSFLNPGILGGQRFFQEEYVYPIERFKNKDKITHLRSLIEPFILRRTKMIVEKDLPELSEKIYYCEMGEDQKKIYETRKSEIRNSIFGKLDSKNKADMKLEVLRGLMQLRLIANHPHLAGNYNAVSGKFDEVMRNIENLMQGGHKLLIFSQFVRHLQLFRQHFDDQNWKYSYLTGELKDFQRKEVIADFQNDPDNLLFLISLRAGGVGLNLTAADYVFILDPWWNPAVEQQAISRAHRIGQKRNVFSYKFISTGSVEEKILKLQQRKTDLAGDFIKINDPLKIFTDDEIIGLFD